MDTAADTTMTIDFTPQMPDDAQRAPTSLAEWRAAVQQNRPGKCPSMALYRQLHNKEYRATLDPAAIKRSRQRHRAERKAAVEAADKANRKSREDAERDSSGDVDMAVDVGVGEVEPEQPVPPGVRLPSRPRSKTPSLEAPTGAGVLLSSERRRSSFEDASWNARRRDREEADQNGPDDAAMEANKDGEASAQALRVSPTSWAREWDWNGVPKEGSESVPEHNVAKEMEVRAPYKQEESFVLPIRPRSQRQLWWTIFQERWRRWPAAKRSMLLAPAASSEGPMEQGRMFVPQTPTVSKRRREDGEAMDVDEADIDARMKRLRM